jgi:hypothetical protein
MCVFEVCESVLARRAQQRRGMWFSPSYFNIGGGGFSWWHVFIPGIAMLDVKWIIILFLLALNNIIFTI